MTGTIDGLRREVRKTPQQPATSADLYAVCRITDDDAFIFGKTYKIEVLVSGAVLVTDENGEPTICDRKDFEF